MELCLTGNMISAEEAEKSGLVARLFPSEKLVEEAVKTAHKISEYSLISVMMAKEAVNKCKSLISPVTTVYNLISIRAVFGRRLASREKIVP